jgi:hypothetical protein
VRHENHSVLALRPLSELRQVGQIREIHGEDSGALADARERVAALIVAVGLETYIDEAAARLVVISRLPYAEFLKTLEWREIRDAALERAGHRCQVCNSPDELQVHHRDYSSKPLESLDDLTVLCDGCHGVFHDHRKLRAA